MKIPLVGQSYALRSPAAAAQQSMNVFPQFIDDPNEQGKNKGILVGAPGWHLMGNVDSLAGTTGSQFRGFLSGGGRCFAVTDSNPSSILWEIALGSYVGGNPSTGIASIVSHFTLAGSTPDGKPGQLLGNGNQLGIVKNGFFYIDNGAGPVIARFLLSGTVNVVSSGTGTATVTWVSGDQFPNIMTAGTFITINGINYDISVYTSTTSLTLAEDPGNQTGALFTAPYGDQVTAVTGTYLDGYFIVQRPVGQYQISGSATSTGRTLTWLSGSFLDELAVGQVITFNGLPWTVDTVDSATSITLTGAPGNMTQLFSAFVGPDLGRQINISALNNGIFWDPLDFATKEGYPDHLAAILADHEQLYLFGTESMEVWQNTGNALFPLQRIPGAMAKEGCPAPYSVVAMGEKVFFIGGSPRGGPVAYRIDGFTPVRISTHAEEQAWSSGLGAISAAVAYAEVHDGHQFLVINFPNQLNTYVYDETASQMAGRPMWHQRATLTNALTPYVPRFHTFVPEWGPSGMHVVGDFGSGNFYEVNLNYFDDAGTNKEWIRILPHLYAGGKLQFFGRMTLEMETGQANIQPFVTRFYSDDRGNSFTNPITVSAGALGQLSLRVFWSANGSSRDRVFYLTSTGQYRVCLIDLDLEIEEGLS
jgi:hypothetical protein